MSGGLLAVNAVPRRLCRSPCIMQGDFFLSGQDGCGNDSHVHGRTQNSGLLKADARRGPISGSKTCRCGPSQQKV